MKKKVLHTALSLGIILSSLGSVSLAAEITLPAHNEENPTSQSAETADIQSTTATTTSSSSPQEASQASSSAASAETEETTETTSTTTSEETAEEADDLQRIAYPRTEYDPTFDLSMEDVLVSDKATSPLLVKCFLGDIYLAFDGNGVYSREAGRSTKGQLITLTKENGSYHYQQVVDETSLGTFTLGTPGAGYVFNISGLPELTVETRDYSYKFTDDIKLAFPEMGEKAYFKGTLQNGDVLIYLIDKAEDPTRLDYVASETNEGHNFSFYKKAINGGRYESVLQVNFEIAKPVYQLQSPLTMHLMVGQGMNNRQFITSEDGLVTLVGGDSRISEDDYLHLQTGAYLTEAAIQQGYELSSYAGSFMPDENGNYAYSSTADGIYIANKKTGDFRQYPVNATCDPTPAPLVSRDGGIFKIEASQKELQYTPIWNGFPGQGVTFRHSIEGRPYGNIGIVTKADYAAMGGGTPEELAKVDYYTYYHDPMELGYGSAPMEKIGPNRYMYTHRQVTVYLHVTDGPDKEPANYSPEKVQAATTVPDGEIKLTTDIANVPADTTIEAVEVAKETGTAQNFQQLVSEDYVLYDLGLSNSKKQPVLLNDNTVKVSLPIPAEIDANRAVVYYYNDQTKTTEKMKGQVVGDDYVFETTHFSYYALVEEKKASVPEKDPETETGKDTSKEPETSSSSSNNSSEEKGSSDTSTSSEGETVTEPSSEPKNTGSGTGTNLTKPFKQTTARQLLKTGSESSVPVTLIGAVLLLIVGAGFVIRRKLNNNCK